MSSQPPVEEQPAGVVQRAEEVGAQVVAEEGGEEEDEIVAEAVPDIEEDSKVFDIERPTREHGAMGRRTTSEDAKRNGVETSVNEFEGEIDKEEESEFRDDDRQATKEAEGIATEDMEGVEEEEEEEEEDDDSGKPEHISYSTRGRASQEDNNNSNSNALDRLAIAGDLLSSGAATNKDLQALHAAATATPLTTMRESFLSDSLTEEERRTRTRYLPEVEGMHALRKQEVKSDLALARSILSASGTTERLAKSKRKQRDEDLGGRSGEEVDLSEDDRMSEVGLRSNNKVTVTIGDVELSLPSTAFVAPAEPPTTGKQQQRPSPREVEAVTAFNPPRPPESVGAKKKHRMLRWERRPADIEVDLSNYRKTVQRTREEWKNAEAELERIETVDNHLRRHFMQHLKCLNEEMLRLGEELATVQQECVDIADLPASRTRTRGAFKGSTVMRDVIHSLRAKGAEIVSTGDLEMPEFLSAEPASKVHGAGGVSAVSFKDWNCSTKIEPGKLAEAWVLPGDTVETPYGEGTVVSFYAPGTINVNEPPRPDLFEKKESAVAEAPQEDAMEVSDSPPKADEKAQTSAEAGKKKAPPTSEKKTAHENDNETLSNLLAPRVAVRLAFGVAFFNLDSVTPREDASRYTDKRLAERWKGIVETAKAVGGTVDIAAMANYISRDNSDEAVEGQKMKLDGSDSIDGDGSLSEGVKRRLVPFGSGMLPTAVGRGALLYKASMAELDRGAVQAFYQTSGILGSRDNIGVSRDVKELEDQCQKHLDLQARVLQLRNQLYRQRRIRLLNEKTYAATQEKASRVESLVAEMRTDLKSLKGRLDLEIRELGISEEQAENILTSFYQSLDSQHLGDASPPKRHRRLSRMDEPESDEDMDDPLTDGAPEDANSADLDAAALLAGAAAVAGAAENAEAASEMQ